MEKVYGFEVAGKVFIYPKEVVERMAVSNEYDRIKAAYSGYVSDKLLTDSNEYVKRGIRYAKEHVFKYAGKQETAETNGVTTAMVTDDETDLDSLDDFTSAMGTAASETDCMKTGVEEEQKQLEEKYDSSKGRWQGRSKRVRLES